MLPRMVNPLTNPNGYLAAAGAVLGVAVMVDNAVHHHGVIDTTVVISMLGAVGALFARQYVTPVRDPKDGNGAALAPALPPVIITGTGGGGGAVPAAPGPVITSASDATGRTS